MAAAELSEDEKKIAAVARSFAIAFARFDGEALASLFDTDAEDVLYQAEERTGPITSVDELRNYISNLPSVIESLRDIAVLDFRIRVHGDAATVYSRAWCHIDLTGDHGFVEGQVRQSFVLVRRDLGWRIVEVHESRRAMEFDWIGT